MKPVPCQQCPLRERAAFRDGTPEQLAFIRGFRRGMRELEAGGTIVREASEGNTLFTLFSGWAFRYKTLSDGRRQILNFLLPGDLIGLQQEVWADASHGVEALTAVQLCVFERDQLWTLYREQPELGYDITWIAAHEEGLVDDNLLSVGRRSGIERVAMLLIHLYKRALSLGIGREGAVPLPITQQHVADALGLSLVHTHRCLRELARRGMYRIENGQLLVAQPEALARLADYLSQPLRSRPLL